MKECEERKSDNIFACEVGFKKQNKKNTAIKKKKGQILEILILKIKTNLISFKFC